jgi:hypothetical protein
VRERLLHLELMFKKWSIVSLLLNQSEHYSCQFRRSRRVGLAPQISIEWIAANIVLELAVETLLAHAHGALRGHPQSVTQVALPYLEMWLSPRDLPDCRVERFKPQKLRNWRWCLKRRRSPASARMVRALAGPIPGTVISRRLSGLSPSTSAACSAMRSRNWCRVKYSSRTRRNIAIAALSSAAGTPIDRRAAAWISASSARLLNFAANQVPSPRLKLLFAQRGNRGWRGEIGQQLYQPNAMVGTNKAVNLREIERDIVVTQSVPHTYARQRHLAMSLGKFLKIIDAVNDGIVPGLR